MPFLIGNKHNLGKVAWNKGTKGIMKPNSGTFKKGHIPWTKGKKITTNTGRTHFKKGMVAVNKGKLAPWTTKRNLETNHLRAGENHYKWKSDRTTLVKRQERNDMAYKEWRRQVWLRDNFKCKIGNPDCKGRLEAHHILGWSQYPELRYEINNGITLCHAHHPLKRSEEAELSPYFQQLVAEMK